MREGDRGEEREKKDRDNGYRGEEERRIGGMREREREREKNVPVTSPPICAVIPTFESSEPVT